MFTKCIGKMTSNAPAISASLDSVTFNSIRKVLPDKAIYRACCQDDYHYRLRLISPALTVLHMITSAIWPEDSFNAGWQLLWAAFTSSHPSSAGSSPHRGTVAKARNRLPLAVWKNLSAWICKQSQRHSSAIDKWRGHRVVLVDGTCLTLPDTADLHSEFDTNHGRCGPRRYPLARMVCLSLARTMAIVDYRLGAYREDENSLLNKMLKTLCKGDLLIGDRHFAGANLYWNYMQNGLEYLTQAHQKLIVSRLKKLWSYSTNDFVAKMKTGDVYRRNNPGMPKYITVRFICVRTFVRGKQRKIWLVTSLLDGTKYPADEIAELYLQRWRIETLFRQFKINISADILRSKSPDAIRKEVVARVCAINIVQIIILESAVKNGVDPMRVSFVAAVRIIIAYAPAMALQPVEQLPAIYNAMLTEIASHLVPERQGRLEPRKITHDPKHYPRLTTTRTQWRNQYAA